MPLTSNGAPAGTDAGTRANRANVFIPLSIQTERDGHYTNFEGVTSPFSKCFPKLPGAADAETLFAALAGTAGADK